MAEAALRGLGSRQRSRRLFAAGMILVGGLGLVAAAAPWLTSYDPDAIVVAHYAGPLPPGGGHAMTLSLGIGVTVGLVGGYFGGAVDTALMWLVDLVLTMPTLLLLIVLATVLPPSLLTIPLVIGVVGWTTFARTVRSEVLSLRERDYLLAARALGASHARIIVRHLLPGVLPGIVVLAALGMSGAIGIDAGLSYLGLGVPLPTPSWGRMVSEVQTYFAVAPWLVVLPGVAVSLAVIGFNLVGYGLI